MGEHTDNTRLDHTYAGLEGLGAKLQAAQHRLEHGPAAGAPSRFGRAGKLVRRLVLRSIRPFTTHQLQFDTALLGALHGVREELSAVTASVELGLELGTVPARETLYLGHPFLYPYNSTIGDLVGRGQEWDPVLRKEASALLPGAQPTICEVGSNIGASLLQILAAKPHARVVAFEPSARFRPFLERNLQLAGFDGVEVFPQALGREPGSMWLYRDSTTAMHRHRASTTATSGNAFPPGYEPRGKELVEVTTLDQALGDRAPLDFLKVDADGFDFEVLRGGETTLERDQPVLHFELQPGLVDPVASAPAELGWLQSLGYRRLLCLTPMGRLIGTTEDPLQATAWADAHGYCDVLTCAMGSAPERKLKSIEFPDH